MLLTRDQFREGVFKRDSHRCVVCGVPAVDAHHILERRLFPDGGYYLDNGASLCSEHHMQAEMTTLTCEFLRECAQIKTTVLPPHLYRDQVYDKWGNPCLANGTRLAGDLFNDASVQKILRVGNVLNLFSHHVKYPRTYHLPWSPGLTKDDRKMEDTSVFEGREVVVTLKMDGENTTMYSDYMHARSLDYKPHISRRRVKALHSSIAHNIPEGWRVCGENLYAKHSIKYEDLKSYFLVFSIWNEFNECLSWDETKDWARLLDLHTVDSFWDGLWYPKEINSIFREQYSQQHEGYVVRLAGSFHYSEFRTSVAKYVRANHVTSDNHWIHRAIEPNTVK